jgi:hypothetical protein
MRKVILSKCIVVALLTGGLVMPAWSDTILLRNGTRYTGTLENATTSRLTFRDSEGIVHRYSVREVQSVRFGDDSNESRDPGYDNRNQSADNRNQESGRSYPPPAGENRGTPPDMERVVLPVGTEIAVRTNESIDSRYVSEGQTFSAEVAQDIRDTDGYIAIPRGAEARLIIRRIEGNGDRTSEMVLDVDSITVQGRQYAVSTFDVEQQNRQGIGNNRRTGEYVGGGAILGTIIGAIAGGGKGAAIGAAAGAAAGGTTQVLTRGKEVRVPAETVVRFRLDQRLRLHLITS